MNEPVQRLASEAIGTVLIMAGGTGGHIFPALSIARNLQIRGYRTEWLGTVRGLEVDVVGGTNIPLHCINVRGLRGKNFMSALLAPFMIIGAIWQALQVVRKIKPCCVVGMGGYVTGPGGVAARISGKKLLIHEQNAIPGFSNRLLALIAHRVMEAFPGTFPASAKVINTGNPVRAEIVAIAAPELRVTSVGRPLHVLIFCGSLGSVAINRLIPLALQELGPSDELHVWHQSGRNNVEQTRKDYMNAGFDLSETRRVEPFITDMAAAYSWADLVICRAGALTVSEIAAAGLPSLLIPYPHAVDDHQTRNAQWLSDAGAAVLIQQRDLDAKTLAAQLKLFMAERSKLLVMANIARSLARPEACDLVARECMEACKG